MRVAHFGTFDVENFGDLLFPLLLRNRLADLGAELTCISPVGGPPVWGDCLASTTIDSVESVDFDGVVLGGGNLVHAGPAGVDRYLRDGSTALFAYAGLWSDAARLAAERGIPLCWNAPGVPQDLVGRAAQLLCACTQGVDPLTVRDHASRRRLREAGVDRPVHVACDPAMDVSGLWSGEEIEEAHQALFHDRDIERPRRTLAIHLNRRYLDEDLETTARRLDRLAERAGATPVLLGLGPCHGDDELVGEVAARMSSRPVRVPRPASLREATAAIGRSDGYVGSSLHGMVTACAFGVPGVIVAHEPPGGGKFSGFLDTLGLQGAMVSGWSATGRIESQLEAQPTDDPRLSDAWQSQLDAHWARMRAALQGPGRGSVPIPSRDAAQRAIFPLAAERLVEGARRREDAATRALARAVDRADAASAEADRLRGERTRESARHAALVDELEHRAGEARRDHAVDIGRLEASIAALGTQVAALEDERALQNASLARAERELLELREALSDASDRKAELAVELEQQAELARLLQAEADAASRRSAVELGELRREAGELRDESTARLARGDQLTGDLAATVARAERLEADAAERSAALTHARDELEAVGRGVERARGELALAHEMSERIGASRSWRLGHALMRAGRVLLLRRPTGDGAMPLLTRHVTAAKEALPGRPALPPVPTRASTARNGRAAAPAVSRRADERRAAAAFQDQWRRLPEAGAAVPEDRYGVVAAPDEDRDTPSTDVVICVHNALDDVRSCLRSLLEVPAPPFGLIVVDDGSEPETAAFLEAFARSVPACRVITNTSDDHGYTVAANIGLRASSADYVVLLNSDTIVTPGWLGHLHECGESDERIGIVGPLSNAASHQSVPAAKADGDWAVNELPDWLTIEGMATIVESASDGKPIRVPFLNGFCYAVRRRTIDAIGLLDEEHFGEGYSEENDYSRRAADAGYDLAVAPQAYVFHAKSRSYGHATRRTIAKRQYRKFLERHGEQAIRDLVADLEGNADLAAARDRISQALAAPETVVRSLPPLSVCFVLPGLSAGASGGAHSIYQEVSAMRRMGVEAQIALRAGSMRHAAWAYDDAEDVFVPFEDAGDLARATRGAQVVVATHHRSVPLIAEALGDRTDAVPAYYIQDYEPLFAPAGSAAAAEAHRSYSAIPAMVHFAKTRWLCDLMAAIEGVRVEKVEPSIDPAVYHPRGRDDDGSRLRVGAMVRPRTQRRAPGLTLTVLEALHARFGERIEIRTFGSSPEDLATFGPLPRAVRHEGILNREEVGALLRETDVFLDCSWYQAFGRTALEAMACGATAVLPARGGAGDFAVDRVNARVVDTLDEDAVTAACTEVLTDWRTTRELQAAAVATAAPYSAARAAISEYLLFQRAHARRALDRERAR